MAQGEHALLVGQRQCSFATGALLIAQELHISVILLEIRGGAVGIVFTGFGTLVIKVQKVYITSESDPISYTGSYGRKRKSREERESPDELIRKKPLQRKL